jgi:GNAT superfamily N-acetyltransferase
MFDDQAIPGFRDDEDAPPSPLEGALPRPATPGFRDEQDDPLSQAIADATQTPPDRAAHLFDLRLKTGLPPAILEQHLGEVERHVTTQGFDAAGFRKDYPALAQWLQTDTLHAAMAQDDIGTLARIERGLRALGTGPFALAEGVWGSVRALAESVDVSKWAAGQAGTFANAYTRDLARAFPRDTPEHAENQVAAFARETAAVAHQLTEAVRGPQPKVGPLESAIYSGLESISLTASGLPLAAVGGEAALLGTLGISQAGQSYTQARDAGVDVPTAAAFGGFQGTVEVLTELLPMHYILSDLAARAPLLRVLWHQVATEVPGEQIATLLQDLAEQSTLHPERTFADYLRERPSAAAQTLVATLVATVGQGGTVHLIDRFTRDQAVRRGEQPLKDVLTAIEAAKLGQRSEAALTSFVETAAAAGIKDVFVDADAATQYFQEQTPPLDPEREFAALKAERVGTDLVIPTARFLQRLANSPHAKFFLDEVRFAPGQLSAREAKRRFETEAQGATEPDVIAEGRQHIYDAIRTQLEATERFIPSDISTLATFVANVYDVLARRRGMDPKALYERFRLTIHNEGGQLLPMPITPWAPTPREAAPIPPSVAPKGETPEQRRVRVETHYQALVNRLVEDAQALDPTVKPEDIRAEFAFRRGVREEEQQANREAGGETVDLLHAIAAAGGLGPESHGGMTGELRLLRENEGRGGSLLEVPGVFKDTRALDARGAPVSGLSFDEMVTALRQDPRFAWLETPDDLYAALTDASREEVTRDTLPGTEELGPAFNIHPGQAWWQDRWRAPEAEVEEEEPTFNPEEFEQRGQRAWPKGEEAARLNEELDALTQQIRDESGTPGVSLEAFIASGGDLFVDQIAVPESRQNEGIGSRMLERLLEWADAHNLAVSLDAAPSPGKKGALGRFYKRHGFIRSASARYYAPEMTGALVRPSIEERGGTEFTQEEEFGQEFEQSGDLEQVRLDLAPLEYRNGRMRVSTRVPFGPNAQPAAQPLVANLAAVLKAPGDALKRWVRVLREFNLLTSKERASRNDRQVVEAFIDRAVQNLRYLWNRMPADVRARARQWYEGAHRLSIQLAERHGLTNEQAAAVLAVLSPQNIWERNVNQAFRVADIYHWAEANNPEFTQAYFDAYAERLRESGRLTPAALRREIRLNRVYLGQRWSEINVAGQALLLREIDEAHNSREFYVVTPEGTFSGVMRNNEGQGAPSTLAWSAGYRPIRKAIAILRDGSARNIHWQLGVQGHKVRSFFNNIADPTNADSVTVDIHAIAASLLLPLGTDHPLVTRVNGENPGSVAAGLHGVYPILAEAYTRLAAKLSRETGRPVLAREVQSVTWTVARELFKPSQRQDLAFLQQITDIWEAHKRGDISHQVARARIFEAAGGVGRYAGFDAPAGVADDQSGLPPRYEPRAAAGVSPQLGRAGRDTARAPRKTAAHPDGIVGGGALRTRGPGGRTSTEFEQSGDDAYQQDLFLTRLKWGKKRQPAARTEQTAPAAPAAPVDLAAGVRRGDEGDLVSKAGAIYRSRTHLVAHREQPLGVVRTGPTSGTIRSIKDAAAALAYLAHSPEERLDALVVDKDGNPLAIVGGYKGGIRETQTYPNLLIGEALRVKGGASVWLAHNHPSGDATFSPEDKKLAAGYHMLFRDTGLTFKGVFAIGAAVQDQSAGEAATPAGQVHNYSFIDPTPAGDRSPVHTGTVRVEPGTVRVPRVGREFTATGKLGGPITPVTAPFVVPMAADFHNFGVVLTDVKHQPIAFVPLDIEEAKQLRTLDRAGDLLRAVSIAGDVVSAFIAAPDPNIEQGPQQDVLDAAWNVANALFMHQIELNDVIFYNPSGPQRVSLWQQMRGLKMLTEGRFLPLTGEFTQEDEGEDQDENTIPPIAPEWLEALSGELTQPGGRRPPRGTYNPSTHTIKVLATANRSTMLHELGHHFLEMLRELSQDGPEQMQTDLGTLLQWVQFEGDAAAWSALTHEERRKYHERFADAFEVYMQEGKAPTPELQPLFSQFWSWLKAVYKSFKTLHVPLSDEVRQVMDRLVATDDAIARAEKDAGVAALFSDAKSAGVSDIEFEGYREQLEAETTAAQGRLMARLLKDLRREREQWWTAMLDTVRGQVRAEVEAEPVYRALRGMRGQLEGQDATPINRGELVAQFGKAILKRLPRPYIYSRTTGLPADTVASFYGFSDGQALLDAVIAAEPMEQRIERIATERMEREHGDMRHDPAALEAEARAAVADQREAIIRRELAMLHRLQAAAQPSVRAEQAEQKAAQQTGVERLRTEMPDPATLQRLAAQQIGSMRLGRIRPELFFGMARRASQAAVEAAGAGRFDEAIRAKQKELLNFALYREAVTAREAIDAARDRFRAMFKPDAPMAKRRNLDYVHAARAIAAQYFWPERRLEAASDALELIRKHDPELFEMLSEQIRAARAGGDTLEAMPFDAFQVMAGTVDALWEQSLRSQQMVVNGRLIERNEAIAALEHRLDELGAPDVQPAFKRWQMWLLGVRAALTRVEHWVDYMDGGDPQGAFRRYLFTPLADALGAYRVERDVVINKYLDLVKGIEQTLTWKAIPAKELGFTFESKAALLHALLHTGNESNFQKLLRGRGWGELKADGTLDRSRWDAFLERMHREGTITKAEWDFVQAVWDLTESVKPAAQKVHRDMYGHYFNEITTWDVVTPFGTYRGGYVPAIVDPLLAGDAAVREEKQALSENDNAGMFPTAGRGFTKARIESYAKPLALDLRLIPTHLDKVLRFIHLEPRVRDAGRLLWTWSMRDRLNAYNPTVVSDLLIPWLQRTVQQRVTKASQGWSGRAADTFFRGVRRNAGVAMMAWNVINSFQQLTGLMVARVKVQPRYLRHAFYRWTFEHASFLKDMHAASPFMATRKTAQAFETIKRIDEILLNPSVFARAREASTKHAYVLQEFFQGLVDDVTWGGAYEQAIAERGAEPADAVREADAAVRQTQGSFNPEDLSRFEVAIPFHRLFVMFSGYFNMLANLNVAELAKVQRDVGLRKGYGRGLYVLFFGFLGVAAASEAITGLGGGWGDDDDDDAWMGDALLRLFFIAPLRQAAAAVPGGQVANSVVNYFNDKPYDDRITVSPAVSLAEGAAHAPKSLYDLAVNDGSARRAVRDTLDAVALLTGLPTGQVKKALGYAADVAQGREEPEGPIEVARGLISGRSQQK